MQEGEPTSARCDDLAALKSKGCPEEHIQNPRGSKEKLKDTAITNKAKGERMDPSKITQLRPQQLRFELRSGADMLGVDRDSVLGPFYTDSLICTFFPYRRATDI